MMSCPPKILPGRNQIRQPALYGISGLRPAIRERDPSHYSNPPDASFTPLSERPNKVKATSTLIPAGFTLVEIMIVVAIIGLLAAIAIPNFAHARAVAQARACINNLSKIDAVACQFALENGRKNGDAINYPNDLTPYLRLNRAGGIPGCPAGGLYSENLVGASPTCSLGETVTPAHVLP